MKMVNGRVLVSLKDDTNTTDGGIILMTPEKNDGCQYGTIVSCEDNAAYAVGDTVIYGKFAGQPVTVDGAKCLILNQEDLLGVER